MAARVIRQMLCTVAGSVAAWGALAANECDKPRDDAQVAACLGAELRESDAQINTVYQSLMQRLNDADRKRLRDEQRHWIKQRDSACRLSSSERDRDRWYAEVLANPVQTVCVTRYTRTRTAELAQLDQRLSGAAAPSPTPGVYPADPHAYEIVANVPRREGKWYFEVFVDSGAIAKMSPTALWAGCSSRQRHAGTLKNIRPIDGNRLPERLAFALDLDDGRIYLRRDGAWSSGAPGSAKGIEMALGRDYRCGVTTTIPVHEMIKQGLLKVNFGDSKFDYAIPDGYRPLRP